MRFVKQVVLHNDDAFRLRVWHKKKFIVGWHAEIKIGRHQWNGYPGKRERERQMQQRRRERLGRLYR